MCGMSASFGTKGDNKAKKSPWDGRAYGGGKLQLLDYSTALGGYNPVGFLGLPADAAARHNHMHDSCSLRIANDFSAPGAILLFNGSQKASKSF